MEGLTAFVSRFEKRKSIVEHTGVEATAERGPREQMQQSSSSNSISLPFSIEEILSDKRRLSHVSEPQQSNHAQDVGNKPDNNIQGNSSFTLVVTWKGFIRRRIYLYVLKLMLENVIYLIDSFDINSLSWSHWHSNCFAKLRLAT